MYLVLIQFLITKDELNYEILLEDFSFFDLSFKLIVIGNSGKNYFLYN